MSENSKPTLPADSRSLRSGQSEPSHPVDNPEKIIRKSQTVTDKSTRIPTTGSGITHRSEAVSTALPSNKSHWIHTEVIPKLQAWIEEELAHRIPTVTEEYLQGHVDQYLSETVHGYLKAVIDSRNAPDAADSPLVAAVTQQVQEQINLLDLTGIITTHVANAPPGFFNPKLLPESVNAVQPRAATQEFTVEPPVVLPVITGSGNMGDPDPPGGPSDDDDDEDNDRRRDRSPHRRRSKKEHDRRRKSRSRSRSKKKKKSRKGRKKRRNHSSDETYYRTDSSDSESSDDDRETRGRRRSSKGSNGKLQVIRPLNDLFTVAVNYKTYRLRNRSQRYDYNIDGNIGKTQKRLDVQMKSHTFTGEEPISVLGFLERFRGACDHNDVSEGAAVWCLQCYLTGSARSILQSRLGTASMAVDEDRSEILSSYEEAVNYLLRTYATDEVIAQAYTETVSYQQSTAITESEYSQKLWDKALRCGSVFSDRRMRSLFVEGLLQSTRAQVRNYLASNPDADYQAVTRYAEALGDTYRSGKRATANVSFRTYRPRLGSRNKPGLFC